MVIRLKLAVVVLAVCHGSILAQHSWVIPYAGLNDSPFHEFGISDTLRVETFEAGELTQPGLTLLPATGSQQGILSITTRVPRSTANSVAEDTGDPLTGSFLIGIPTICATSYPPLCPASARIQFDETSFGLPSFVGFVWTDAVRTSSPVGLPIATIKIYGSDDQLLGTEDISGLPPRDDQDVTADDLFIGFLDYRGVRRLEFLVTTDDRGGNLSIDHLQYGTAAIPGDANLDGSVGFADFLTLSSHFSDVGNWQDGDFNFNGVVAFDDFLKLSANFGTTSDAAFSTTAVPEPSVLTLLASLVATRICWPKRRPKVIPSRRGIL